MPTRTPVCLVSSSGGHFEALLALRPALGARDRVWITSASRRAEALRSDDGEAVTYIAPWDRGSITPKRFLSGIRVAFRLRPRIVVTTGAGMVLPFCLAARALGARLIFVETMARISTASASGRILSRLADTTLVQWPEMASVYRDAKVCRPILLEGMRSEPSGNGEGTLVAVGTHSEPFDRLLAAVDRAVEAGTLPAPVTAQAGSSTYVPTHYERTDWLAPDALERAFTDHRYIVCHTGSGMVSGALRAGRRPLVMARTREHGEHVDDHQVEVAGKLDELGLAVAITGGEITPDHLRRADGPLETPRALLQAAGVADETRRALDRIDPA